MTARGREGPDAKPLIRFGSPAEWEAWLCEHHASSRGVWLDLAKKGSGAISISYPEALELALCWGWIDGVKKSAGAQAWFQKFTPRAARSIWSKINRDKAEALIAAGRMQPSGLAEVERAKADGRWARAYDAQSKSVVPEDLLAALSASKRAAAFFETLDSRNRYAILHRIQTVKLPATRARLITKFVDLLAKEQKLYP